MARYGRSQPPRVITSRGRAASVVVATRTVSNQRVVLVSRGSRYGHIYKVRNALVPVVPFLIPAPKIHVISPATWRTRKPSTQIRQVRNTIPLVVISTKLVPQIHINLVTGRQMMSPAFIKFLRTQLAASSPVISPVALWINTWP